MQKKLQKLIHEVGERNGLSPGQAEKAYMAYFRFISDKMMDCPMLVDVKNEDDFYYVTLPFLGMFRVTNPRLKSQIKGMFGNLQKLELPYKDKENK